MPIINLFQMAPENTLISFQLALNNSAFGIETDVAVRLVNVLFC